MFYVQANIEKPENWSINGVVTEVPPLAVVGFHDRYDAEHFVTQNRAVDLGEWAHRSDLEAAIAEHNAKQAAQQPAEPEFSSEGQPENKRGPGRKKKDAA